MGFQNVMRWKSPGGSLNDILSVTTGEAIKSTGTILNVTIPALTLNKSLLLFTYKSEGTTASQNDNRLTGQLTSTTNIQFTEWTSNTFAKSIRWYIIEFTAISPATVQRGSTTQTAAITNQAITAIDLAKTFPITSTKSSSTSTDGTCLMKADFTSTTNMSLTTLGSISQITEWQILEHPSWDITTYTNSGGAAILDTAITAVVLAETWVVGSYFNTQSNLNARVWPIYFNTSTTNIRLERAVATGGNRVTYYVIEGGIAFNAEQKQNTMTSGTLINTTIATLNQNNSIAFGMIFAHSQANSLNAAPFINNPEDTYVKIELTSNTNVEIERTTSSAFDIKAAFNALDFSPSI